MTYGLSGHRRSPHFPALSFTLGWCRSIEPIPIVFEKKFKGPFFRIFLLLELQPKNCAPLPITPSWWTGYLPRIALKHLSYRPTAPTNTSLGVDFQSDLFIIPLSNDASTLEFCRRALSERKPKRPGLTSNGNNYRKNLCAVSPGSSRPFILHNVYTWSAQLPFGLNPAFLSLIVSFFPGIVPTLSFRTYTMLRPRCSVELSLHSSLPPSCLFSLKGLLLLISTSRMCICFPTSRYNIATIIILSPILR